MAFVRRRKDEPTRRYPNGAWEVRWQVRDQETGAERWRGRSFARQGDALRFKAAVETDIARGEYVDPKRERTLFGDVAGDWLAAASIDLKPKTLDNYRTIYRSHVERAWSARKVGDIAFEDVQRWVSRLNEDHSPAVVREAYKVLRLVLGYAVTTGKLRTNPCNGKVRLPRLDEKEMLFLTADEVHRLAEAVARKPKDTKHGRVIERPDLGLLVRFAAYTGLRAGRSPRCGCGTSTSGPARSTSPSRRPRSADGS